MVRKEIKEMAKKVVKDVLNDNSQLEQVLENITIKNEDKRYANSVALQMISEENPELLYPNWDFFAEFLDSTNSFHKAPAIITIANLTKIDVDGKFEKIFDKYYNLLDDKSIMITRYIAQHSGTIAKAKPKLQSEITNRLLSIDKTNHDPKRLDLVKGDIVDSFKEYYTSSNEQKEIVEFVKKQLKSSSPSTIKKAKEFLKILESI